MIGVANRINISNILFLNRKVTIAPIVWTTVSDGLIVYRKGIRGSYYVIDYSSDGGVTWELNLVLLDPTETSIIIDIDAGVADHRHEVRGNDYCIDAELTALGFAGVENTDWENIYIIDK